MRDNPYARFSKNDLILRDQLAIDRTILANERTLLSYLRGAVAMVIARKLRTHLSRHGSRLLIADVRRARKGTE